MTSKFSKAKPTGSNLAWQAAQVFDAVCLASNARMVVAPRMSGSTAGTLFGGGGGGWPSSFSMIQTPRSTGEVVVPFAVCFISAAWVMSPPYGLPFGKATRCMAEPLTRGRS